MYITFCLTNNCIEVFQRLLRFQQEHPMEEIEHQQQNERGIKGIPVKRQKRYVFSILSKNIH